MYRRESVIGMPVRIEDMGERPALRIQRRIYRLRIRRIDCGDGAGLDGLAGGLRGHLDVVPRAVAAVGGGLGFVLLSAASEHRAGGQAGESESVKREHGGAQMCIADANAGDRALTRLS